MIARISVVELIVITPAATCTIRTPAPTPKTAVPIGINDATIEPRVSSSTISATTRPRASTTLMCGTWMEKTSPPTSTVAPGRVSVRLSATSVSCSRWASVNVDELP